MAAATPKRSVRWNFDDMSYSDLGSPGGSSDSYVSTSSLEYANSQLLAHGYVERPGLCLDGISTKDSDAVVKCLMKLLGDRMADMSRTEELTTKLRTLSYEHERLRSMNKSAEDKAANAEREASLHKSKLAATQRTLQASESAHKKTSAELQRTKTSLQAIRSTHQAELKKREKDLERMAEKWQKMADLQTKIANSASGITCSNVAAVEGRSIANNPTFVETALEEAEKARAALLEDNNYLKALVLKAVNSIQRIDYQTKALVFNATPEQEPTPFTITTLFPLAPATHSAEKLSLTLISLRSNLEVVSEQLAVPQSGKTEGGDKEAENAKAMKTEVARLQSIIDNLQDELDRCHKQLERQALEITDMCERFAEQQQSAAKEIADISVDLEAPLRDEERERLERLRETLEQEQRKLSEAAAQFGKEKAALEAERLRFLDEKETWEVERTTPELPPPPPKRPASPARIQKLPKQSPRKGSHKSPKRVPVKKVAVRPKSSRGGPTLGSPKKVIPACETEILPPMPSLNFSTLGQRPLATSLLSTTFVLPPPSPYTSLPSNPVLLPPAPSPEFTLADLEPPKLDKPEPGPSTGVPATPGGSRPSFPVAKPFASRMVHAYSPAKPSPLSRILMLGDTPGLGKPRLAAPDLSGIGEEDDLESSTTPDFTPPFPYERPEEPSLAAQLGVESPPDTPLQEKKSVPNVVPAKQPSGGIKGRVLFPEQPKKVPRKEPPALTAREKGKMRASEASAASGAAAGSRKPVASTAATANGTRAKRVSSAVVEKENSDKGSEKPQKITLQFKDSPVFKPPPRASSSSAVKPATSNAPTTTRKGPSPTTSTATDGAGRPPSSTGSRPPVKPPSSSRVSSASSTKTAPLNVTKGGPRRVPIDSAEAPAVKKRG